MPASKSTTRAKRVKIRRPYHHGDLRRTALEAAAASIARDGIAALNLRAMARAIGVSHTALQSTFGDRAGLLTALAAEGFELLGAALDQAPDHDIRALGHAYIGFAAAYPGHFALMFSREIVPPSGVRMPPDLNGPSERAFGAFLRKMGEPSLTPRALHAWGLVHGVAQLLQQGPLRERIGRADAAGLIDSVLALVAERDIAAEKR